MAMTATAAAALKPSQTTALLANTRLETMIEPPATAASA